MLAWVCNTMPIPPLTAYDQWSLTPEVASMPDKPLSGSTVSPPPSGSCRTCRSLDRPAFLERCSVLAAAGPATSRTDRPTACRIPPGGSSRRRHRSTPAHRRRRRHFYEERRQEQFWARLDQVRREWVQQPPVLVEVSHAQIRQVLLRDFDGLPEGVDLAPGSITIKFAAPEEAL